MTWLPLYHDMGLVGMLLNSLAFQLSVDLLPTGAFVRRPEPVAGPHLEEPRQASPTPRPSATISPPAAAAPWRLDALDLSSLAGGRPWRRHDPARTPARLRGRLHAMRLRCKRVRRQLRHGRGDAGADAFAAWARGCTPTWPTSTGSNAAAGPTRRPRLTARSREFALCGQPLHGHRIEVRDDAGARLGERRVGRVFASGPSLMKAYFGEPAETAKVLSGDGWLDTGDLGYQLDGQIVITGRAKDLIIVNGRNVWPQDLEWTAEAETAGLRGGDVAVFSVFDGRRGAGRRVGAVPRQRRGGSGGAAHAGRQPAARAAWPGRPGGSRAAPQSSPDLFGQAQQDARKGLVSIRRVRFPCREGHRVKHPRDAQGRAAGRWPITRC